MGRLSRLRRIRIRNIFAGVAAMLLTACDSGLSEGDARAAMQAYHDANPACFRVNIPYPTEANETRVLLLGNRAQVQALAAVGLLEKRGEDYHIPATTTLHKTDNPTRDSSLCMGRFEVTEILKVAEPIDVSGVLTSYVEYEYRLVDVADWATKPAMSKALFPLLHKQLAWRDQPKRTKAPLVKTAQGWAHFHMAQMQKR